MFLRVCRAFRKTAGLQQLWNPAVCKLYATESPNELTNGERKLLAILRKRFPKSKQVEVADISGGCGAMYEILIEADEFHGKNTLAQHRMVNESVVN